MSFPREEAPALQAEPVTETEADAEAEPAAVPAAEYPDTNTRSDEE